MKIAKYFRILGTIIMIIVIILCLPFVVPRIFGTMVYEVVTSSMTPELPVGTVVYVKPCESNEINVGDIITFYLGTDEENIISHRVVEIDYTDNGTKFTTKGDSNSYEDEIKVDSKHLLGKVKFKIKNISWLIRLFDTITGWIIIFGCFLIALCLYICSDILTKDHDKKTNSHKQKDENNTIPDKNKKFKNSYFLITISIILIIFSLYNIIEILIDYNSSNDLYAELNKEFVSNTRIESNEDKVNTDYSFEYIKVDFEKLKQINPDVVGWIYFENDDLSYPVLYSGDNDKYLRTTIDGSDATAGAIFIEGGNSPDFQDQNTIVYGHNMRNLSMFGKLKKYIRESDYYDNNKYFQIITPDKSYRYIIFAYETVDEDSDIYQISFSNENKFLDYVSNIRQISEKKTDISVLSGDKIITLSTCSTVSESKRFVVHAVRVDEQN